MSIGTILIIVLLVAMIAVGVVGLVVILGQQGKEPNGSTGEHDHAGFIKRLDRIDMQFETMAAEDRSLQRNIDATNERIDRLHEVDPADPADPVDPVDPPPDPGGFGMAELARKWLLLVPVAEARLLAPQIAANYEFAAVLLKEPGTQIDDIEDDEGAIRVVLGTKNRDAAGPYREAWLPWFTEFQKQEKLFRDSMRLITLDDYAQLFTETARGLK